MFGRAPGPGTSQPELEKAWAKMISGFIYDENPNGDHHLALTSATVICRIADSVLICVASGKGMDRFQRLWRQRLPVMVKQHFRPCANSS
ncbi:hypothetical protein [Streptomyces cyaneofuscatus]|uniref:hypothetical protein n=1 Tax=Streptomyces cyaneofuscatus TaxID=66883 RepID=UPI0033A7DC8E